MEMGRNFVFSFLILLSLLFSGLEGGTLSERWEIVGPHAMKCPQSGSDTIVKATEKTAQDSSSSSSICSDPTSAIRLEYSISKLTKYGEAKYRIKKKDCDEDFASGTEPVRGITSQNKDNTKKGNEPFSLMSLSSESDNDGSITASVELSLANASSPSLLSWLWSKTKKVQDDGNRTVEFCIRMSLWLPQPGGDEVNFRESNVAVTLAQRRGIVIDSIMVNPKKLKTVKVNIGSFSPTTGKQGEGSDINKNDEL